MHFKSRIIVRPGEIIDVRAQADGDWLFTISG